MQEVSGDFAIRPIFGARRQTSAVWKIWDPCVICKRRRLIGEQPSNLDLTDYISSHLAPKYLTRESQLGPNETSLKIRLNHRERLLPANKLLEYSLNLLNSDSVRGVRYVNSSSAQIDKASCKSLFYQP